MIWERRQGSSWIGPLEGLLYRLVESQEQVATLGYVDTLEEQALLEHLLETVKPPLPEDCKGLHYLLATPFRYPPLKWGSRFGRIHERSLFYGGCDIGATLAESAYYRFVFWTSMSAGPVKERIRSEHTLFSVGYRTRQGIRLHAEPFLRDMAALTDPVDYRATQQLGSAMREAQVQAFEYRSARDPAQGNCVGLFTPAALRDKRPQETSQWFCEASGTTVSFSQLRSSTVYSYDIGSFLVDGVLPMPA